MSDDRKGTQGLESAESARECTANTPPEASPAPTEVEGSSQGGPFHLVTGFPGFIGGRLVARLLRDDPSARVVALVQARMLDAAQAAVQRLHTDGVPDAADRLELAVGDITEPNLGLCADVVTRLRQTIQTVWHLAALYDLAVSEEVAYQVNVVGTQHVIGFCRESRCVARLNYVSTCYVAGDREGLVLEDELDCGQRHKNHYESTKFWAELEVQRAWDKVPTTVFRPAIVVGDSKTGHTEKYDGPYFLLRLLLRAPRWIPFVNIGRGDAAVNLVPIDFVVDAMIEIGAQPNTVGRVFQLADPNPMRARDLIQLFLTVLARRGAIGTLPQSVLETALLWGPLKRLIGIPREAVIYFNHPVRFDATNTLDALRETPVRCPHMSEYARVLVDYLRRNPDKFFLDGRAL